MAGSASTDDSPRVSLKLQAYRYFAGGAPSDMGGIEEASDVLEDICSSGGQYLSHIFSPPPKCILDSAIILSKDGEPTPFRLKIQVSRWTIAQEIVSQAKDSVSQMESAPKTVQSLVECLDSFLELAEAIAVVRWQPVRFIYIHEANLSRQVNTYAQLTIGVVKSSIKVCPTSFRTHAPSQVSAR